LPSRVLIADDHAPLRMEIRSMLASESDIEVVGRPETARKPSLSAGSCTPSLS